MDVFVQWAYLAFELSLSHTLFFLCVCADARCLSAAHRPHRQVAVNRLPDRV